MVITCHIDFDNNPLGTYFAGQVVTGKVTLTADKPKQVKGVALKIYGYAKTNWTENSSNTTTNNKGNSTTTTVNTTFSGREDYIASITYLLGSDADQSVDIAPGIHTFNFVCHIPVSCPSSFESRYGHIRYVVRVALIRPWKFDQTFTKGFTVLKIMDLNYESPMIRVPAHLDIQKTFCCGPCQSSPMKISVTLAEAGFVPGQNIPITVAVTNDSNVPITQISIALLMLVCLYSQTPSTSCKTDRIPVSKLKGEGVPKRCQKIFNYELPVPATPPTCFNLCRIIQVAYEVYVEAQVKGMHSNQVIGIPVVIGNVPLIRVIDQQPMAGMNRNLDTSATECVEMRSHVDNPTASVPWTTESGIPPPSYQEAMHVPHGHINEDEKHDFGESDFTPRYPVFNMTDATAPPLNSAEPEENKATNGTWL